MAQSRRVRKQAYGRKAKPVREAANLSEGLYNRCLKFVEQNSSLALDDSFDRHRLAEEMEEFVRDEIFLEISR